MSANKDKSQNELSRKAAIENWSLFTLRGMKAQLIPLAYSKTISNINIRALQYQIDCCIEEIRQTQFDRNPKLVKKSRSNYR